MKCGGRKGHLLYLSSRRCAAAITNFATYPVLVLVNIWHFWSQYEVMSTYSCNCILRYPPVLAVLNCAIE